MVFYPGDYIKIEEEILNKGQEDQQTILHYFVYYTPEGEIIMYYRTDAVEERKLEIQPEDALDQQFPIGMFGPYFVDDRQAIMDARIKSHEYRVDLTGHTPKIVRLDF